VLAKVYLHALEEFMEQKKQAFDQGRGRRQSPEWKNLSNHIWDYRKRRDALQGDPNPEIHTKRQAYAQTIRHLSEQQKRLDASDPLAPTDRRLFYVRYADAYLMGIIGNKQAAERRGPEVKTCLNNSLQLEVSEEQSGIHHAKEGTAFLGYVVKNHTSERTLTGHSKSDTRGGAATRRPVKDRLPLRVPQRTMSEFCPRKGYGSYEALRPSSKPSWGHMDAAEILLA
jgi:hypothetical protein